MELECALETSTRSGSVAVAAPNQAPNQTSGQALGKTWDVAPTLEAMDTGHAHASDLLPAVARALGRAGAHARDLRRIFVGLGPGSYTGLRVAVAAAVGFAVGDDALELYSVASAEALLFAHLAPGATGVWLSDARSDTLYALAAERTTTDLVPRAPLAILPRAEAPAFLAAHPDAACFCDLASEAALASSLGADHGFSASAPTAADVLALGRARRSGGLAPTAPADLEPLYLREFAAKVAKR